LDATIASILPRLADFTDLLVNPPNKIPVMTTAGLLDPPLGQARLRKQPLLFFFNLWTYRN
jgi:serine/threonine-protein phosphatase 6 regulatory subunit 3